MEKYNLNEGNEALNRALLMMKYDSAKTLNENVIMLLEGDNTDDYYEYKIKQLLKYPETHKVFKPSLTEKGKLAAKAINNSISGLGTDLKGVNHAIDNGFSTLEELIGISKFYKETYNNSLFSDLKESLYQIISINH